MAYCGEGIKEEFPANFLMKKHYDVIIVGAGPAGLACAEQLATSHLSVLLLEKNGTIGPKACAGGITHQADTLDIPEDRARTFREHTVLFENREFRIVLKNPVKTIARSDLGLYQLSRIQNSVNIEVKTGVRLKKIENNTALLPDRSVSFTSLVGADGSTSIIRKHLGLSSKACIGLYYDIPVMTERCLWYVNPALLRSGYIWVFPHREHTSIGVYFNPEHISSRTAQETLEAFLEDNSYSFSRKTLKGAPVNHDYQGCVFGNIYLAGDAAGLASRTTGEGIPFAILSGRDIGNKILDPGYGMTGIKHILKYKKRQEKLLKVYEGSPSLQGCYARIFISLMKRHWFQAYFGI